MNVTVQQYFVQESFVLFLKRYQVYVYTYYSSKNIIVNENTFVKSIRLVGMHEISEFSIADKIIKRSANKSCFTKCFKRLLKRLSKKMKLFFSKLLNLPFSNIYTFDFKY